MRFLVRGILAAGLLLVLASTYFVWNNNRAVPAPTQADIRNTLEDSIQWLAGNREKILNDGNPMLWLMVKRAGDISGDTRLKALFADYEQRYLANGSRNIWRPLFYPKSWVPVRFEDIADYPYYNWHFIYAFTCDRDLAREPEIAIQNDPAFCDRHRLKPACVTHQMMGMLLLKRSECSDQEQLDNTINTLQARIRAQLTWDPRVVDVYMQRVLMLADSGATDMIKPVWLRRLVDAQLPDGSWSAFMPLIPLGGGKAIGTSRLLSVGSARPNFHMTAQGVLLFALLAAETG